MTRFEAAPVLAELTGFQRCTVEHILDRFYGGSDCRRFLTADETGLGKSMVARGVIAGAIERLQDDPTVDRIDVVYVCSNSDIAAQNLERLNVVGEPELNLASRLTLMAQHASKLRRPRKAASKPVNLVAFTPGTSFDQGFQTGRVDERALLQLLLIELLDLDKRQQRVSSLIMQGYVEKRSTFEQRVDAMLRSVDGKPDRVVTAAFKKELAIEGSSGRTLRQEYRRALEELAGRRTLYQAERSDLAPLISRLRGALAKAGVETLEPDLVILDEFQRFRHLLDESEDNPHRAAAELAHNLFRYHQARVLLLSATPYKPFTYAEESITGDEHSRDFLDLLRFLYDDEHRADEVRDVLREFRDTIVSGSDPTSCTERIRSRLLDAMTRVERPQLGHEDMLAEHATPADDLEPTDLVAYSALRALADTIHAPMALDYWKSAPYFINFLEGYKIRTKLQEALDDDRLRPRVEQIISGSPRLDRERLGSYEEIDLGNAKLRRLAEETVGRGCWRLPWLPPSLPYLEPGGAYADLADEQVTKRLVFSSWAATPTAVASLLSYEASRQVRGGTTVAENGKVTQIRPRLQYRVTRSQETSQGPRLAMTTFLLFAPNPGLATACDPLDLVSQAGGRPLTEAAAQQAAVARIAETVGPDGDGVGTASDAWYVAEAARYPDSLPSSLADDPSGVAAALVSGEDESTGVVEHAHRYLRRRSGPIDARRPADLQSTLADLGLHAPGNVAWRALSRLLRPGHEVTASGLWSAAAVVANGLRSLFNRPEVMALLDSTAETDQPYWRTVLRQCADGNLQAVLDEYAHHVLAARKPAAVDDVAIRDIANRMQGALALRPATYQAFDPQKPDEPITMTGRFALRYGSRRQSTDEDARRPEVREAFNSPFWPFVLATTSVGQEGIDLHWWCHSVVHWNTPANPVDFEQREGRVHRYAGHAIRKNLASRHGAAILASPGQDPWTTAYALGTDMRPKLGELAPHWVYPGPAKIERHVYPYPLSSDRPRLDRVKDDVALYRLTLGQPRQEDFLQLLRRTNAGADLAQLDGYRIDLSPPGVSISEAAAAGPASEPAGPGSGIAAVLSSLTDVEQPVGTSRSTSATIRAEWEAKYPPELMRLVDQTEDLIQQLDPAATLNFTVGYAGIIRNGKSDNYVLVYANKRNVLIRIRIPWDDALDAELESAGAPMAPYARWDGYGIRLTPQDFSRHRFVLTDLIRRPRPADVH